MSTTKKLTLSAMMTALSVVLMIFGVLVQVLDLTVAALVSLVVAFVYIEVGAPFVHFVWLASSALTFIFFPTAPIWLEYFLIFGPYPILKGYIERAPRCVWMILKLAAFNLMILALFYLTELVFGVPLISPEESLFGISGSILVGIIWVIMNIAFVAYDMLITVMVRIYIHKYRDKIKRLLK